MTLAISWSEGSTERTIEFDAVTREAFGHAGTVTEHAVESGAPLADHKRASSPRVTIEAVVSNTPIGAARPMGFAYGPVRDTKGDAGIVVEGHRTAFDRVRDALDVLSTLAETAQTVTISTRYGTRTNMQIVKVDGQRGQGDGGAMRFVIEAVGIRIATSRRVEIAEPTPREPRGAPTQEGGTQGTTTETEESVAHAQLRQMGDAIMSSDQGLGALLGIS